MSPEQAADFWRNGAHHLGLMCAFAINEGDMVRGRTYARRAVEARRRALVATCRARWWAHWFGEDT